MEFKNIKKVLECIKAILVFCFAILAVICIFDGLGTIAFSYIASIITLFLAVYYFKYTLKYKVLIK